MQVERKKVDVGYGRSLAEKRVCDAGAVWPLTDIRRKIAHKRTVTTAGSSANRSS